VGDATITYFIWKDLERESILGTQIYIIFLFLVDLTMLPVTHNDLITANNELERI
jgi:hypothetical protein